LEHSESCVELENKSSFDYNYFTRQKGVKQKFELCGKQQFQRKLLQQNGARNTELPKTFQ